MKKIGNRASAMTLVIVFFLLCTSIFLVRYVKDSSMWVTQPSNRAAFKDGLPKNPGNIVTADGAVLYSADGYSDDETLAKATLHTVGDSGNNIASGVLRTYKKELIGYDKINGVFNPLDKASELNLTIDSTVSKAAYDALGKYNGTVGVYNYKTGEIICMVSKPSFSPASTPDLTDKKNDGIYINRLTNGLYTPGSIMKIITSAAALEQISDIKTRKFACNGGTEINGEWIKCTGNHGSIDFNKALAVSCNAAYAEIAVELGGENLTKYVRQAGVLERYNISGVTTPNGRFNVSDAARVELAWAGIGQYTTMVNPIQYMIYMGAIANEGQAVTPYYVKSVYNSYGLIQYHKVISSKESQMINTETAKYLKAMMRNNVKSEYGDSGFSDLDICGKTGTAEIDGEKPNSWFVGFSSNTNTPLAFVVVVENSESGAKSAIPVAKKVLAEAKKIV